MSNLYKLSCALYGHTLDVRGIAVTPEGNIISGSRDRTAKVWKPNGESPGYTESQTFIGHTNFVSCVCTILPSEKYPSGLVATGSNDNIIRIFIHDNPQPVGVLQGHSNAVCSLSSGVENDFIISASWDGTARVWEIDGQMSPVLTLTGHEMAVWSAVQLNSSTIVSGSADKTIKVWNMSGICNHTLTGHTDCVRSLAVTSVVEFLSCANDATIKQWNVESGSCLKTFYGHTNFIYSLSVYPGSGGAFFLSSGEDNSIRVWRNGECEQTLYLPSQSVWAVSLMANGDIVSGSSDSIIRIFSCDPSRQADEEVLKAYEKEVANLKQENDKQLGGLKVSDLPGKEVLFEPGTKEGQTKLIREDSGIVCYSWSAANGEWTKVGDVMGASGGTQSTSGKQLYNGKEYDYIFSVDIEDGKPALKLPYNASEDPWFAAQKFIHDNNLSQLYLDQVANFIIQNSKTVPLQANSENQSSYCDPFTGSNRYIPGASESSDNSTIGDPFTGTSRYVPSSGSSQSNCSVVGSNGSLFTSGSSHKTNGKTIIPNKLFFPQTSYLRFDQANLKGILEKLLEFNKKTGDGVHQVPENMLEGVVKLGDLQWSSDDVHIQILKKLLDWPQDIVFPVLDVLRLAVRNSDINKELCSGELGNQMIRYLRRYLQPTASSANQMLALRTVANMFSQEHGEKLVLQNKDYFLSVILDFASPYTKHMQVAMCTVILNFSVAFNKNKDISSIEQTLRHLLKLFPQLNDSEAVFRALVALGTLLWNCDYNTLDETTQTDITISLDKISSNIHSEESKVSVCAAQLNALLKS